MSFELPQLPYEKTAFAGFISEEGFNYHYGKHHQTYVTNLNNNIKGTKYEGLTLEQIIIESAKDKAPAVFNNAAQHWNHSFFWNSISPAGGGAPKGKIADLINADFGSYENFKEKFAPSAVGVFGSGWCWLVLNADGKLEIVQTSNAANPIVDGKKPLFTVDVWEHAYYIDHRNLRAQFVAKFWDYINWDNINKQL
jgi:superoxide dismutase, Fe-Mn family